MNIEVIMSFVWLPRLEQAENRFIWTIRYDIFNWKWILYWKTLNIELRICIIHSFIFIFFFFSKHETECNLVEFAVTDKADFCIGEMIIVESFVQRKCDTAEQIY